MCKTTRTGLRVVRKEVNRGIRKGVSLTRKTLLDGSIKYGVVVTELDGIPKRMKLGSYNNILDAWGTYKRMLAV